jgi:hypothetical protein
VFKVLKKSRKFFVLITGILILLKNYKLDRISGRSVIEISGASLSVPVKPPYRYCTYFAKISAENVFYKWKGTTI